MCQRRVRGEAYDSALVLRAVQLHCLSKRFVQNFVRFRTRSSPNSLLLERKDHPAKKSLRGEVLLLHLELELKAEKDNAEVRQRWGSSVRCRSETAAPGWHS